MVNIHPEIEYVSLKKFIIYNKGRPKMELMGMFFKETKSSLIPSLSHSIITEQISKY